MSDWIRVTDALPVEGKVVFTYADGAMASGFIGGDRKWKFSNFPDCELLPTPTHWMFLPEPPSDRR